MAQGSAQYREDYVPPRGDAMGSKRSTVVKNALKPSRSAEDEARLAGIVRRARGTKADEMAPGVQAEAQKRFAAEQARTAGMKDFSDLAGMDVDEAMGDAIDIPSGAPAVPKGTSDVVKVPDAFTSPEGITYYRPKGDPFQYEYNAADRSFKAKKDGQVVVTVKPGDPAYEEFLKHAKGERTRYSGGGSAAPKAPAVEAPAAEVEAESTVDEFGNVDYGESSVEDEVSIPERGDTAMSPEVRSVDAPTGEDASSPAKYNRGVATSPQKPEASGERPKISPKSGVSREERLGEIGTLAGADFKVGIGPYLESILGSSDPAVLAGYIRPDRSVDLLEVGDALRRDEFSLEDWNFLEKVLKNAGLIAYDAPPTERRQLAAASAQRRGLSPLSQRDLTDIGR